MIVRAGSICVAMVAASCLLASVPSVQAQPVEAPADITETGALLARYPDISSDKIAFVYADKLWVADRNGSGACQLAVDGAQLSHVRFSPDGAQIAVSARKDGNTDVYVVMADGTAPAKRITHHPAQDFVVDWAPDSATILFASNMSSARRNFNQFHSIPATGGLPTKLPLPYGETAAFSDDGGKLLFTYMRDFQEEAWKRYYGGRAPDIWSYDFASGNAEQITNHSASDSGPMAIGQDVYFLSERDDFGRANIWRLRHGGSKAEQVTNFVDTDVRNPASDGERIIFEAGGRLHILDPVSGTYVALSIQIDRSSQIPEPKEEVVSDRVLNAALVANDGVVAEARGDIYIYDSANRIGKNLTATPSIAERYPYANARGDIAYLSDRDGEYALYVRAADDGVERKVADFGVGMRYRPHWSPDGARIALFDYRNVLWLVDVRNGAKVEIDTGLWRYHGDLASTPLSWSRDGRWLAYARGLDNRNNAIFVYDSHEGKRHQLTSGAFNDYAPAFDPSGNYLLMLSHRHFQPTYGDIPVDTTFTYTGTTVVGLIPLRAGVSVPTAIGWEIPKPVSDISIDFDGAEQRIAVMPPKPGNYGGLAALDQGFAVVRQGRERSQPASLEFYNFGQSEPHVLKSGQRLSIEDFRGRRLLLRDGDGLSVYTVGGGDPVAVSGDALKTIVDRDAEARQIFKDAWRYARDFYYDPGLHGADWDEVRRQYEPLVEHTTTDEDLTFVVREMMGELNGGHVYASATAPRPRGAARNVGLLGIDFARDEKGYRIAHIYRSGPRAFAVRSPLDDASLGIAEGDYIFAVNGISLNDAGDPWASFEGLAEKEIELTIGKASAPEQTRTIKVRTLNSEQKLRELSWVEANRKKVTDRSGGRIGYIYVPDTGANGLNELMIQYRSQIDKDALIIDERFNTGGALGDRFVELLNRPPLVLFHSRNSRDYPLPELAHRGPKTMLINGWSYSGGDGFPLLFKTAKVGPLVGKRTWGGLIGPGMRMELINGGFVSPPPQRVYNVDGEWSEGNEGVRPDIEVLNNPGVLARGVDQQLDTAIDLMLDQIADIQPLPEPDYQSANDWNLSKKAAE